MTTPSNVPEQPIDQPAASAPGSPYTPPPAGAAYAPAAAPAFSPAPPAAGAGGTTSRSPLGLTALILGIIVLFSSSASLITQAVVIRSGDYLVLSTLIPMLSVVQGALAVAAIVCGAIGLAQRGRPKGAAGVGLGIGITALWAVLGGLVYGLVLQFTS